MVMEPLSKLETDILYYIDKGCPYSYLFRNIKYAEGGVIQGAVEDLKTRRIVVDVGNWLKADWARIVYDKKLGVYTVAKDHTEGDTHEPRRNGDA
jgi:hypothetical protein